MIAGASKTIIPPIIAIAGPSPMLIKLTISQPEGYMVASFFIVLIVA